MFIRFANGTVNTDHIVHCNFDHLLLIGGIVFSLKKGEYEALLEIVDVCQPEKL